MSKVPENDSPESPLFTCSSSCPHTPRCPAFDASDHDAARIVASHPEQGWNLLCNGVVVFEDTGEILPSGACIAPHRPAIHVAPLAA